MTRTLENCGMIKKYGYPEQKNGKCLGFSASEDDDEPCEICKKCKLNNTFGDDNEVQEDEMLYIFEHAEIKTCIECPCYSTLDDCYEHCELLEEDLSNNIITSINEKCPLQIIKTDKDVK